MNVARFLQALAFAARKHRDQRRKDRVASPYINHPIAVATVLAVVGRVEDEDLLIAALLHDTVEDTETSLAELKEQFGPLVADLVAEVSDDKSRPKMERKRLQVLHAPQASQQAKQLKIADKICNISDITSSPPSDWTLERRLEYLSWSERVVNACRGINPQLDSAFDAAITQARIQLEAE